MSKSRKVQPNKARILHINSYKGKQAVGSSHNGSVEMNLTSNHGDTHSTPGITQ